MQRHPYRTVEVLSELDEVIAAAERAESARRTGPIVVTPCTAQVTGWLGFRPVVLVRDIDQMTVEQISDGG